MERKRFNPETEFKRLESAVLNLGQVATTPQAQESVHQVVEIFNQQALELARAHEANQELLNWISDNITNRGGRQNGDGRGG